MLDINKELYNKNGETKTAIDWDIIKRLDLFPEMKEKKLLTRFDMVKLIPNMRKEFPWLKDCNAQSLQAPCEALTFAYDRFFAGGGYPKKHKPQHRGTIQCPQGNEIRDGKLSVSKFHCFRFKCSERDRSILNSIKIGKVTIIRDGYKYFASILYRREEPEYQGHNGSCVGIDLGVVKPLTVAYSVGNKTKYRVFGVAERKWMQHLERRRKMCQKRYARKQKGSNNQRKAKELLTKAYYKERCYRQNFIEQISHKLASNFAQIKFEDLVLSSMTKRVKKNEEGIRNGSAAKTGLNRELLRLGLSSLVARTEQKAFEHFGQVDFVQAAYTSQRCSKCNTVSSKNRKTQKVFKCVSCGYHANADKNAAKNILNSDVL